MDSVFIRVAVSRFPTPALRRGREEESPDSIEQDALLLKQGTPCQSRGMESVTESKPSRHPPQGVVGIRVKGWGKSPPGLRESRTA